MNKLRQINRYGSVLVLTATVLLLLFTFSGYTQAQYNPDGTPVTGGTNAPDPTTSGCPEARAWEIEDGLGINELGGFNPTGLDIIGWLVVAGLGLAAVLALVMIVFGGVRYIVGAGNSGQQEKAKETIRNALLGLILAMASTLILYTINPQFTTLRLPQMVDVSPEALQIRESTQRACDELTGDGTTTTTIAPDPSQGGQAGQTCAGAGQGSCNTDLVCDSGFCTSAEGKPPEINDTCVGPGSDNNCTIGLLCNPNPNGSGYVCQGQDLGSSVPIDGACTFTTDCAENPVTVCDQITSTCKLACSVLDPNCNIVPVP